MNTTTTLAAVANGAPPQHRARPDNFPAMLEAYRGEVARALPRHLSADNMLRVALTCFRMNPRLKECRPESVFACVIQASQLGLRPGVLGECYLIPYRMREEGMVCTLQLGYQGLLDLVRRSGMVESIGAYLVHQNDVYAVKFGTDPGIVHEPCLEGDPGPVKFGYAVAKLKGGGVHVEVMSLEEILRIRDRSQNVRTAKQYGKETPWDTDFDEMARKTLIRRICKYLPKSTDLAQALALDDAAFRGQQQLTMSDAIGNSFVPPPYSPGDPDPVTGEVEPPPPPPPPPAPSADAQTGQQQRRRRATAAPPAPAADQAPPPAVDEREDQAAPPAGGPTPRTYQQYAEALVKAANREKAVEILDEARTAVADPQQLDDLGNLYWKTWGEK